MSRIGNLPISIPEGVEVSVGTGHFVTVKGKKGESTQEIDSAITVKIEDGKVILARSTDEKDHRAKHGLYRSLIHNMIIGVSEGYKTVQELIGVGYRAEVKGQKLELALGYSHNVVIGENSMIFALTVICGSTIIGKNSKVAPGASVINKITIGDKAQIGLGAVVVRNIPAGIIVAGNPAKKLK